MKWIKTRLLTLLQSSATVIFICDLVCASFVIFHFFATSENEAEYFLHVVNYSSWKITWTAGTQRTCKDVAVLEISQTEIMKYWW